MLLPLRRPTRCTSSTLPVSLPLPLPLRLPVPLPMPLRRSQCRRVRVCGSASARAPHRHALRQRPPRLRALHTLHRLALPWKPQRDAAAPPPTRRRPGDVPPR